MAEVLLSLLLLLLLLLYLLTTCVKSKIAAVLKLCMSIMKQRYVLQANVTMSCVDFWLSKSAGHVLALLSHLSKGFLSIQILESI
jgi:hypothetical protein